MSETATIDVNMDDPAEIEAAIARMMAEIDQRREQMRQDQAEIERLEAESRAMRDEAIAELAALNVSA